MAVTVTHHNMRSEVTRHFTRRVPGATLRFGVVSDVHYPTGNDALVLPFTHGPYHYQAEFLCGELFVRRVAS